MANLVLPDQQIVLSPTVVAPGASATGKTTPVTPSSTPPTQYIVWQLSKILFNALLTPSFQNEPLAVDDFPGGTSTIGCGFGVDELMFFSGTAGITATYEPNNSTASAYEIGNGTTGWCKVSAGDSVSFVSSNPFSVTRYAAHAPDIPVAITLSKQPSGETLYYWKGGFPLQAEPINSFGTNPPDTPYGVPVPTPLVIADDLFNPVPLSQGDELSFAVALTNPGPASVGGFTTYVTLSGITIAYTATDTRKLLQSGAVPITQPGG